MALRHRGAAAATASVVTTSALRLWRDAGLDGPARGPPPCTAAPMSVYEVHLGSWRPGPDVPRAGRPAAATYVDRPGLHARGAACRSPEHPFGGSWGYQVTAYYAPMPRFGVARRLPLPGRPRSTSAGIGVIMDWVPAHFPKDDWALARFDGERAVRARATRAAASTPTGAPCVFDFGRTEVRNFLVANALYWLRGVPHRRPAGRRRRLDALPGLLPRGRRVAAQPARRPREPGGGGASCRR